LETELRKRVVVEAKLWGRGDMEAETIKWAKQS